MEINLLVVYAVSAIIFAYFKFRTWRKKHPEEEWSESIKVLLAFAAIGGGIVYLLAAILLSKVTIIDRDNHYETKYYYSKAIIKIDSPNKSVLEDGVYTFNGLSLGSRYIANLSYESLILYPVVYGTQTEVKDSVIVIPPSTISKVKNLPSFYFEEPTEIQVRENIFVSMFNSILGLSGPSEVKWIIDSESNVRRKIGAN